MKKIIYLFLLSLILTSFNVNSDPEFNIVGKWEGIDDKEVAYFIFQEDGYALFQLQRQTFGGKEFEIKGKKGSLSYEINYSSNPMEIDFIVTIFEENKSKRMFCIAEKINNDKIKIAIGFSGERPTSFEGIDQVIFKRVKN